MKNTFNLAFGIGDSLHGRSFRLQSQQIEIQGVTVDNANSDLPVLIYGGTSPNGTPYYVAPGRSISIALAGHNAVYAQFHLPDHVEHKSKTGGSIYISVSSEPAEHFTAGTVSIAGPVELSGDSINVTTGAYPPAGAVRPIMDFYTNVNEFAFTSQTADRIVILDGPGPGIGPADDYGFCVVAMMTQRFHLQPWLEWVFESHSAQAGWRTISRGYGNAQIVLPLPYVQIAGNVCFRGVGFRIVNAAAIIGTFRGAFWLGGFYLQGSGHGIPRPPDDPTFEPEPITHEQRNTTKTRRRQTARSIKTKSTQRPSRAG